MAWPDLLSFCLLPRPGQPPGRDHVPGVGILTPWGTTLWRGCVGCPRALLDIVEML